MTFKELIMNVESPLNCKLTERETLILRRAFYVMLKDKKEESKLTFDILFENEKQRNDWDLVCSCGALFHCEDENEANCFIEDNNYCSVCGRKFRFIKNNA